MQESDILRVLEALRAHNVGTRTGWVTASCLFAPWTHAKGADSNPSFGIKVAPESHCYCYSCGVSYDLYEMLLNLRRLAGSDYGMDYATALKLIMEEEEHMEDIPPVPDYQEKVVKLRSFKPFPEAWLESFKPGHTHPYLADRGISQDVGKALDVRFDTQRQRLCFPYRTWVGTLAGMQGRDVSGKSSLRYLSYDYKKHVNRGIWLGEQHINVFQPVVLTEGPLDYAKIFSVYSNVLASLTSALSPEHLDRLQDVGTLLTLYDLGTGGDHARARLTKAFPDKTVIHLIEPKYDDAGEMPLDVIQSLLAPHLD